MKNLLINLISNFENIFLPEIVSRRSEEVVNERKLICKCGRPEIGQMIACEHPKCEIGLFHYSCVNITRAPKGSWMYGNCRNRK